MKKYLSGIIVMALAITFSSFSTTSSPKPLNGEKWFQLIPGGNPSVASDYSLFGNGSTAPACEGSNVCAKFAVPNPLHPEVPNLATTIDTKYRMIP